MVWLWVLLSLPLPRGVMLGLWIFSSWFEGVFTTWYWPVLGFICMPHTTLWYSAVVNSYGGEWGFLQILLMILSVLVDLGVISVIGRPKK